MVDDPLAQLREKTDKLNSTKIDSVSKPSPKHEAAPLHHSAPPIAPFTPHEHTVQGHKYHSELSLASMLLGILGLILPLFSVLAIIFGISGLMQTHRNNFKGGWMAWLGIVLGFLAIIAVVVAVTFGIQFLTDYLARFGGIETLMGKASAYLNRV